MKTKSIFKYFALFLAFGIMSCGSDDQGQEQGQGQAVDPVATSIAISANTSTSNGVTTLFEGESITFEVLNNLGVDVTEDSVITVNGEVVTGNFYEFLEAGTYDVVVTNGNFTNNMTIVVSPPPSAEEIMLTSTVASCWVSEETTFQIMDNLGNDVTGLSVITVGGVEITDNPHVFVAGGTFDVVATYSDLTSNTVSVTAVESTHTTKVLVEDYTGTWCGYCPRLAYKIDQLAANNANVIPVAVHNDNPFYFSQVSSMESEFGVNGYPTGKINRTITWNESDYQVLSNTDGFRSCGLAINSSLSGSTLSIKAKVHYDIDAGEEHKLVVYVLENGLLYDQENYMNNDSSSPWYGAGNPIPNFEHEHVARAVLTDVFGDQIPAGQTVLGSTYSKDFIYTIPAAYSAANLELVAFVVNSSGRVVNVQKVKAGSNQDFD
jgi:thiol-disulfide isomerase/thioredoxin